MSTHKHIDKICYVVLTVTLLLAFLFMNGEALGIPLSSSTVMDYESKLFDISSVHTIEIVMEDWDEFIENCTSEEYYACTVVIDNESYKNVAIRAKGNTSLTQVQSYGNNRYSFKIEFDHYDSSTTYYGLDKLCLNNIIQDNTYMKDYLTYQMMGAFGVASPLCSYVDISVNGENWGLYLAVEGIEESFLQRNYGNNYGEVYKPDSQSMGGGRGNGEKFEMNDFLGENTETDSIDSANSTGSTDDTDSTETTKQTAPKMPSDSNSENPKNQIPQDMKQPPDDSTLNSETTTQDGSAKGHGDMTMSSDDVLLKYIDDEYDSYSNIFDNAKTDISDSDKDRLIESLKKLSEGEDIADTVDVEAVIRYFAVHNFVLNFDSYTGSMIHNYYLYEENGQMSMIPWDYNLAFGGFQSNSDATSLVNYPIDTPISSGTIDNRPMLAWIFSSEEYTEMYHQYFSQFISEYFDSGYFEEMMDTVSSMIAPYVEKDPTKFCTYEEFNTGISTLKEFCLLRAQSINGQLNGTIGSTSETQSEDTLIDAGNIEISDMGSMNNSKEQDGMDDKINSSQGDMYSKEMQKPLLDNNTATSSDSSEQTQATRPDAKNADNNKRTMSQMQTNNTVDSWIWIGISVGILLFGLIFAFLYKRRR